MAVNEVDEYALEEVSQDNAIEAGVFVPFSIVRLQQTAMAQEATLSVQLRDIESQGNRRRTLHLTWSAESLLVEVMPVQEHIVTEWAAMGIACVLVPLYAGKRVLQVTQAGDGFDYWVGDGEQEYALEISGTVEASLESRHTAKVQQLRQNPYGVDGYIAVTRFVSGDVIFSFNRYEETE